MKCKGANIRVLKFFFQIFFCKKPTLRPLMHKLLYIFLFISRLLHLPPLVFQISFLSNGSFIKKIKRFWLSNQFYPLLQREDKMRAHTPTHARTPTQTPTQHCMGCSQAQATRQILQHCSTLIKEVSAIEKLGNGGCRSQISR